MAGFDPLWVPVLTHYEEGGERLDVLRVEAQIMSITPHVRQYLIAGTTGDGWGMKPAVFQDWLDFCSAHSALDSEHTILVGAFGRTTEEVIAQAERIENHFRKAPPRARFAGLTICAPVDAQASQEAIMTHIEAVLAATSSPIAIYQLPQVTGNLIAPETFWQVASENPRITLFKDTSGGDAITAAGAAPESVKTLRGMEGDYAEHIKPFGDYDGWLLSTANGFGARLRQIARLAGWGEKQEAQVLSEWLSALVNELFARAGSLPSGNPFSNANRAVDHLNAYAASWRQEKALLADGSALPEDFLADVEAMLKEAGFAPEAGYISG